MTRVIALPTATTAPVSAVCGFSRLAPVALNAAFRRNTASEEIPLLSTDEVWQSYERLLRWRVRPDTIHSYQVALHDLWRHLADHGVRWDRVTPEDVEAWLSRRCHPGKRDAGLPLSKGTRATYARRVLTFYTVAAARGWLTDGNPLADWRPPPRPARRPRALPVSAIGQLMVELAADRRLLMIVALGYHQGLRIGEICRLSVEDLALSADPPTIRVDGKGGREVEMDLSPTLVPGLRAWLLTRPSRGPLIPNYRFPSEHLSARYGARLLAAAMRPLVGDSGHALRHTAAQQLRRLTADPYVVKEALRHSSLDQQLAYVRAEPGLLAAALGRLPDPTRQGSAR